MPKLLTQIRKNDFNFVYFKELLSTPGGYSALGQDAQKALYKYKIEENNSNDNFLSRFDMGITLLTKIQLSEKAKETQLIKSYIERLEKVQKLEIVGNSPVLQESINKQINYLTNENFELFETEETQFFTLINATIQDIDNFKFFLKPKSSSTAINFETIKIHYFEFINSNTNSKEKQALDTIHTSITKQLNTLSNNSIDQTFKHTLEILILEFFMTYIAKKRYQNNSSDSVETIDFNTLANLFDSSELDTYLENFITDVFESSHIKKLIEDWNQPSLNIEETPLDDLLQAVQGHLGIDILDENILDNKKKKTLRSIMAPNKNFTKTTKKQLERIVGHELTDLRAKSKFEQARNQQGPIKILLNPGYNSSHGFLGEILQLALTSGGNFFNNVGADLFLTAGYVTFYGPDSQAQKIVYQTGKEIAKKIDDAFAHKEQDRVKQEKEVFDYTQQLIKKANDELKGIIDGFPHHFLTHLSMKLYATHNESEYASRKLTTVATIGKLYSMLNEQTENSSIFVNQLIPQEDLEMLLRNIAESCLGHDNLIPLQNYLSLFAGLLIFDDLAYMAYDTMQYYANNQQLQEGIHQLHIMEIDNKFYPISTILQHVIDNAQILRNQIATESMRPQQGARVIIIPHKISPIQGATIEDWKETAKEALNTTYIKIFILKNLHNFYQQLGDLPFRA